MLKRSLILLLSMSVVMLISCSSTQQTTSNNEEPINQTEDQDVVVNTTQELTFDDVLTDLNDKRDLISKNEINIKQYIYTSVTNDLITSDEAKLLLDNKEPESSLLTEEQALEDVDALFRIFKHEYGGYVGFGGDETFGNAKENIVNELSEYSEIYISALEQIIVEELAFINDGHLHINGTNVNEQFIRKYYFNEKIGFNKDNKGFYTIIEGKRRYIEAINGDTDIESYMKLSIDEDGNLVNYIGMLKEDGPVIEKLKIKYNEGESISNDEIDLIRASTLRNHDKQTFEEEISNGIPVITLRRCDDIDDEILMKNFVESGQKYKDDKVLVIDLRGNSGGSSMWSEMWFKNYTGFSVERGGGNLSRYGPIHKQFNLLYMDEINTSYLDKYDMPELNDIAEKYYDSIKDIMSEDVDLNYKLTERNYQIIDNDNIIFVLIDKGVASAAEDFVLNLKSIDNVVVVGSNTLGCSDVANIMNMYLPNSNINVYLGLAQDMKQDAPHFFDGVGLEPDIWLANSNMLERVLKLIEKNVID